MNYYFMRFPEGKAKAVTFSYDDNVKDNIRMAEALDRHGIKCTFNLNAKSLLEGERLTVEEAKAHLLPGGHEIAVHTDNHRAPGLIGVTDGIREVLDCRRSLEQAFGGIIRGMAYPDSGIRRIQPRTDYETIRRYLRDLGIAYSRSLGGDNNGFELPEDWYNWIPTAHHENPLLFDYIDEFTSLDVAALYTTARRPRLFYLWGHAYEFRRNDNWDRLDEICKRLGGKSDIWYATNIEIYDYIAAFRALQASADGMTFYNPTVIPVWLESKNGLYRIGAGEQVTIS